MPIVATPKAGYVPQVTETYARSLTDNAVLFIDHDGAWKVGKFGSLVSSYKNVSFGANAKINDLTYDVTAVAAAQGDNGGYKIYAVANTDATVVFEVNVDANGAVQNYQRLSNEALWSTESRLNIDLNGNGGIGQRNVLINDSSDNLYADANGDLFVQASDGKLTALLFGKERLNLSAVGDLEFADVTIEADGALSVYLTSDDGDLYFQAFDKGGLAVGDMQLISEYDATAQASGLDRGILRVSDGESLFRTLNAAGQSAEAKTGVDLNRQSDTALTPGWTSMLKTTAVKDLIEKGTANGAKLDYAGVVGLLNTAIESVGGAQAKISQTLLDDLRAIAARGRNLFGANDTTGSDTGYLAYVFDKVVNDSDANAFFTGGTTSKQTLGNLGIDSTAAQLGQLRDKWLLGKDLPNPNTEGDTANPTAKAATGIYKAFDAPLFTDGAQYQDVNQGSAGTCYLLASLADFAVVYPKLISSTFVSNSALDGVGRTFGVRFYDQGGGVHWVTVNDQLVVASADSAEASYAKAMGVDATGKAVPEMWVPLLEKAYAQFNELKLNQRTKAENAYFAIEGGGAEMTAFLLNRTAIAYNADQAYSSVNGLSRVQVVKPAEGKTVLQSYIDAVNAGLTLWIGADKDIKDGDVVLLKGGHAHMAFDADLSSTTNSTVTIYNPWGTSSGAAGTTFKSPFQFDLAQLVGVAGIDLYIDLAPAPARPAG